MIKNEMQYKVTKSQLEKFSKALEEMGNKEPSPMLRLEMDAIESQLVDLRREIEEYDDLKAKMTPITGLDSIDELPKVLIKARISLGLTQKELGDLVGLKEQQIQRYESNDYESASLSRVKEIADALNLAMKKLS